MATKITFDANAGEGLDYRYGREFDPGWFRAVVLKAKPHQSKANNMNIRVAFGVDAEFTHIDEVSKAKTKVQSGLRVDYFAPISGKSEQAVNRRILFVAIGYPDVDRVGGDIDIDEWYGCECMVKLKTDEYNGEKRAKIDDLKPITPGVRTRRENMPAMKVEEEISFPT